MAGKRWAGSLGTRTDSWDLPDSYSASGISARIFLARTESSSIGVTASRSPRTVTARAPAWPSLMRACWSAMRLRSGSGDVAEAVLELLAQRHQVGHLAGAGDPAVDVDLGLLVGDVVRRHVGVDVDVEAHGLPLLLGGAVLVHGRHRLVEHLHVELEAERRHVAGLLVAEQVAGPAQLEVAHGDLEAGPELGVVAQRRQPLGRLRGQRRGARIQQVGVGALARPARRGRGSGRAGTARRCPSARRSACWPAGCRCPTR